MRDTRRQDGIAVLLAGAGLLGALGAATNLSIALGIAAGLLLTAALWAASPPSNRVGLWTIISRWNYRRRLRPKPGWESGNVSALAATPLVLTNTNQQPLPGFLCEVQGPSGDYFAYTAQAQQVFKEQRATRRLALPSPQYSAMVLFPDDFTTQEGQRMEADQVLPNGRYHVLWWCWYRRPDGVSVGLDYVAGHHFDQYRAGLKSQ